MDAAADAVTVEGIEEELKKLSVTIPGQDGDELRIGVDPASVHGTVTPDEVRFDLKFIATQITHELLNLGRSASDQKLNINAPVRMRLETALLFDFAFGVKFDESLVPGDAFFVEVKELTASVVKAD